MPHIERLADLCGYKSVKEPFELSFMVSSDFPVSPYVVLLCNHLDATVKGDSVRVSGPHGSITSNLRNYINKHADVILHDIETIDEVFNIRDDGMAVD